MQKIIYVLFFSLGIGLAQDTILVKIDAFVENLITETQTPGLAIAVFKNNEISYSKTFGKLDVNSDKKVDENTLFAIGSISKSFTSAALAMLVDQGKINWDDKVLSYLQEFQLYDPWVTREFTIRDLLLHHTGYDWTAFGTLYYGTNLSRYEILKRLKYLKPETSFRSKLAYQNITYMIAGLIIEQVSGQTFEKFIEKNIFKPIGMNQSFAEFSNTQTNVNLASPHILKNNTIQKVNHRNYEGIGPAGAIYSTAKEMACFGQFIINQGIVDKDTLIAPKIFSEVFKPHIYFPLFGYSEFEHYGFGWFLSSQSGYKIIEHSGGVDGFSANIVLVPEINLGIVVLCNQDSYAPFIISRYVIGQYIGVKNYDESTKILAWQKKYHANKQKRLDSFANEQIKDTTPSVALQTFSGTYYDEMYGEFYITLDNEKLRLSFEHSPTFKAQLEHYHYNTFRLLWEDPLLPDGMVVFNFSSKNEIKGFDFDMPRLLDADFKELNIKKKTIKSFNE